MPPQSGTSPAVDGTGPTRSHPKVGPVLLRMGPVPPGPTPKWNRSRYRLGGGGLQSAIYRNFTAIFSVMPLFKITSKRGC